MGNTERFLVYIIISVHRTRGQKDMMCWLKHTRADLDWEDSRKPSAHPPLATAGRPTVAEIPKTRLGKWDSTTPKRRIPIGTSSGWWLSCHFRPPWWPKQITSLMMDKLYNGLGPKKPDAFLISRLKRPLQRFLLRNHQNVPGCVYCSVAT